MYNKPFNSIVCIDKNINYFSLLFKQGKNKTKQNNKQKKKQKHTPPPLSQPTPPKTLPPLQSSNCSGKILYSA